MIAVLFSGSLPWRTTTGYAQAGDWPQWRGPDRNGVSNETGLLKTWPESGPKALWRIPFGEGFSAVSVSGGRLYSMFAKNRQEFMVCLDASTGREIWRYQTGSEFSDWQGGDGPRSTPAVDGDRIYALSAHGILYALNAKNGAILWKHDFTRIFRSSIPQWGFSTSPLVEGDLLLMEAGGRNGNALIAFDKHRGHVVWSSQSDAPAYSSPIAVDIHGARQIIFFTARGLVAVSPADGSLLWRYAWQTSYDANIATPVFIAPDKVFISSGYDKGAAMVQIHLSGGRWQVRRLWESRGMKNHFASSVLYNGYLYGFDNAILKCIAVETGEETWKIRGFEKGSLIVADRHLIILGGQGELAMARATHERYEEITHARVLSGQSWTAPSLAAGRLYLRNAGEMVCLDLRDPSYSRNAK